MTNILSTASLLLAVFAARMPLVAQTPPCIEANIGADLLLGDDQVAAGRALGFSFPFGGTSTSVISVSSNGFLWLGTNTDSACCNGNAGEFLSLMARIAVVWTDLDPSSSGSVHLATFPGRAVVTWNNVVEYGGSAALTAQVQLLADGSFIMSWQSPLAIDSHTTLTGIARGSNIGTARTLDITASLPFDSGTSATVYEAFGAGQIDLGGNVVVFTPNTQGGYTITRRNDCRFASFSRVGTGCPASLPVTLIGSVASRPVIGSNFDMIVGEAPAGAAAAAMLYGAAVGGTSLTPIGMTGCALYSSGTFAQVFAVQGRYSLVTLPIPNQSALVGAVLYNQAALVAPGSNPLGVVASNGGRIEIGT